MLNTMTAWTDQVLNLILRFVSRTVFIWCLDVEYLGVNGLFSNILTLLSLAELGVGTAITFSMYRPIAEKKEDEVIALLQLYKKTYITIGLVMLIIGASITPVLDWFIKDMPDIPEISAIYLLYLLNSVISYFFSYRISFIIANQRRYIVNIVHSLTQLFVIGIQVVILLLTKNFILYLVVQIIGTFLENVIESQIVVREYPFVKTKKKYQLDRTTFHSIVKNIGAMVLHRFGSVAVFATDNMILSKMIGLVSVGIYSNYSLVVTSLTNITRQFFISITSSVGNLNVEKQGKDLKETFGKVFFFGAWMYAFCSICCLVLFNSFIELWIGKDYLLEMPVVFVIVFNFFLTGMRQAGGTFIEALGLFWYNRFAPLIEAPLNLISSIIFVKCFGMIGVFLGTALSTLCVCMLSEPYVLYKYGLKRPLRTYYIMYVKYTAAVFLIGAITMVLCSVGILGRGGIGSFILKMLICAVVPNVLWYLLFRKTEECVYFVNLFKGILDKMGKKFVRG